MPLDLYAGRVSGNSARSLFGLIESGAEFKLHLVDPHRGENKTPEYLAINPMGKIPALSDGGFTLWESNAINWYAAEKHPSSKLLPATSEGRARIQQWLLFQAGHVSPACRPIFVASNARMQAMWKFKGDPAAAEAGKKELGRYLPVLDAAVSKSDWLEGEFSIADIAHAPHLWLLVDGGFELSQWPNVNAWMERILARPGWQKTLKLIFD